MSGLQLESETERHAAFRQIFEAVFDDLSRFVTRRIDADLCEDVVSETFLVAWRRFDEIPRDLVDVRLWLFATARRVMSNAYCGRIRATSLAQPLAGQTAILPGVPAKYVYRIDTSR